MANNLTKTADELHSSGEALSWMHPHYKKQLGAQLPFSLD